MGYWMVWANKRIFTSEEVPNSGGKFTTITTAGGEARARGFEAEMDAVPVQGLQLQASVALLDTAYTKLAAGSSLLPNSTWSYAPKWSYHLAAQYDVPLPNLTDSAYVDAGLGAIYLWGTDFISIGQRRMWGVNVGFNL